VNSPRNSPVKPQPAQNDDCLRFGLAVAALAAICVLVLLMMALSGSDGATLSEYMPSRFAAMAHQL
jgi:hypothetical protein